MELRQTAEALARDTLAVASHVGSFVAERLFTPGGWSNVAPEVEPANIQVYEGNLIKGEE